MRLAAVLAPFMLSGCITFVAVHGERADDVKVTAILGAADVQTSGKAVSIDSWGFGASLQCDGTAGIGIVVSHCIRVDQARCPVAIVKSVGPIDEDWWGSVATEERVVCPHAPN